MVKITWNNRSDTAAGETRQISASIFNDTKTSINAVYDIIEAQLGTTSSVADSPLIISGNLLISGNIIPSTIDGEVTSSLSLGSPSAAWKEIYVSTGSLNFVTPGGEITSWSKKDVDDLVAGKSLNKGSKQLVNELDDTTYVRMSVGGKAWHYASNKPLIKLDTASFDLGDSSVPMILQSSTLSITGSTSTTGSFGSSGSFENTGSFESTGSFNVNNLLDLLANYGETGIPTGSGEGGVSVGDINLDGQVNVNDLLLVLAGYGNPNIIVNNTTIPPNVNHQYVGPVMSISQSITLQISTGSFCSITF